MEPCIHCEDMSAGYKCYVCGRTDGNSDFEFQWYCVSVRIHAKEPDVLYRHGPRKGEVKTQGWTKKIYESPTHYYNYGVQGIRNAAACESLVKDSFRLMVKEFEALGYTDIQVSVSAIGVHL